MEYKEMNNDMNKIYDTPIGECENEISTIQKNLKNTTEILYEIDAKLNNIMDFIWSNSPKRDQADIEIINMDTNIVNNMIVSKRILEKLMDISRRLGC